MGLDMSYQAIPAECGLVERAREDKDLGEMLCLLPSWFRDGHGPRSGRWLEADALWREVRELARQHLGLEKRNCFLDRWWDKLHYLLSANRRGASGSEADNLLDKAILGDSVIAEHARAPQGIPVKYVGPAEVDVIAALLESISGDDLRANYSRVKMEASGVYKCWADRADEREWAYIAEYFAAFRNFYLATAGREEGVIVCLD